MALEIVYDAFSINRQMPIVPRIAQVPPHNRDAEQSVLGSVLLDPDGIALEIVEAIISPQHFYVPQYGRILQACIDCRDAGQPVDSVLVAKRLEAAGALTGTGGVCDVELLVELQHAVPHPAHAGYYARIVEFDHRRRQLQYHLRILEERIALPDVDLDEIAAECEKLAPIANAGGIVRFSVQSAAEFAVDNYRVEYWIPGVLVKGQPCIVGAAQKGLKTSICAIDLSLSLATGSPFLGNFEIADKFEPAPGSKLLDTATVCVMSGESGLATLQETARRVCRSKGWALEQVPNWFISADIPSLTEFADLVDLQKLIVQRSIDVLIIDPIYLACNVGTSDSSNRFAMGKVLRPLADISMKTGVTIVLIHHTNKPAAREFGNPPELTDLSHAGFAEFARQWILIGRRSKYEHDGRHKLIISFGGSAGHSGLWAVDIEEGRYDDPDGRQWEVAVYSPDEEIDSLRDRRKATRSNSCRDRIISALQTFPNGETKSTIQKEARLNSKQFAAAFTDLQNCGMLEDCEIERNNGQTYLGFRLTRTHFDTLRQSNCPTGQHSQNDTPPVGGVSESDCVQISSLPIASVTKSEYGSECECDSIQSLARQRNESESVTVTTAKSYEIVNCKSGIPVIRSTSSRSDF